MLLLPHQSTYSVSLLLLLVIIVSSAVYLRHLHQYVSRIFRGGASREFLGSVEIARREFLKRGNAIVYEGYQKYRDSMFIVQTADMERIIISPKYLPELRSLPESKLSLRRAMSERHFGPYTTVDTILSSHLQSDICRHQLTQNLGILVPHMLEELGDSFHQNISYSPGDNEWIVHYPAQPILSITAQVFARVLVGGRLCRDPRWLNISVAYTRTVFELAADLRSQHPLLRPLLYRFLASHKRLKAQLQAAKEILAPLLETERSHNGSDSLPIILHWMKDSAAGSDQKSETLVRKALFLCMASIHTSSSTICQALFDLCAQPDTMNLLRQEFESEIKHTNGKITLTSLNNMRLLDSFLKESQRLNHPGTLSFNRKVVESIRLSDGSILPAGAFIAMPTSAMAIDPTVYSSPNDFQADRFLRQHTSSPTDSSRHSFASTSTTNLAFGYGKYACPGRFFAATQIKLLLVKLLLEYDIKYPEGQVNRPESVYVDERIIPSPTQELLFRPRAVAKHGLAP